MWNIVEAKQQPSRRRKQLSSTKKNETSLSSSNSSALKKSHEFSSQEISSLVKDLRRTSQSLRKMIFVRRDVLLPLRQFLHQHEEKGIKSIHIIGLGIGPFSRTESKSGFLQMALLLVIQKECEIFIQKSLKQVSTSHSLETHINVDAITNSYKDIPQIKITFFDPITNLLHNKCCEKLGINVELKNRYGVYTPSDSNSILIVYLPHSPWTLLRNLFISNITSSSEIMNNNYLEKLKSTLVIGNDIRAKLGKVNAFMDTMTQYLLFHIINVRDDVDIDDDNEFENQDDCLYNGLRGISRYDLLHAFSDTVIMKLNLQRETELIDVLKQMRIPSIVRSGSEIL